MGDYILGLPFNIEDSLRRLTRELTEDASSILTLLSDVTHIRVDQNGILSHNSEEDYDEDSARDDGMSPSQDPVWRRSLCTRGFMMRRWSSWRRPRSNWWS